MHRGVTFHRPVAFWSGVLALVAGVAMQLPDFFGAAGMQYRLRDMPMSSLMDVGMVLIVAGLGLAASGLLPGRAALAAHRAEADRTAGLSFESTESGGLTAAHHGLLLVLGVALVVDVMKPASLGFVIPGMKTEYGLSGSRAALLPFVALTGAVLGSLLWGYLADRLGRRAAILLAALMFIGTSVCGVMPSFGWNLVMCSLMGFSAGGMLPIVYALMSESVPAVKRGWLVVLQGGLGLAGGYLAASGLAALLQPTFGWRIMWLLNLPTGALVVLLNRWIPESPRFLFSRGRQAEAIAVMARYGMVPGGSVPQPQAVRSSRFGDLGRLFHQPYLPQTMTVLTYGLGWGLVNFGFLTFLPTILGDLGFQAQSSRSLLFQSALISVPGSVVAAWLYGHWSAKRSMMLYAAATAATLAGFALLHPRPSDGGGVLTLLVVLLLVTSGGAIAMLSPYTAEVYPTHLRGMGSGLAAGGSKAAGVIAPPLFAGLLGISAGVAAPALVVAAPIAVSVVLLGCLGVETRGRHLEEISAVAAEG